MNTFVAVAAGFIGGLALVAASIAVAIIGNRRWKRRKMPRRSIVEPVENDASPSGSLGVNNLQHGGGLE